MTANSNSGPGYQKHPDYRVDILPLKDTVRFFVGSKAIAETQKALIIEETGIAPVYYIPLSDLISGYFLKNSHETYCPFKGVARYWDICIDGNIIGQAAWGYDKPYDEVAILSDYVAFYRDKVSIVVD
ncbi:DUF427 domain-containing protein [Kordiimonas aquimaris]|uniref:DUF427 domain-containing protein n=1 Tax=Kordiimonas aquimaris TaxID=707591 RepID=UPI0021CDF7E4|nr:DUF427 domain-containing protein [Kordiimonas aquimaris]